MVWSTQLKQSRTHQQQELCGGVCDGDYRTGTRNNKYEFDTLYHYQIEVLL